MTANKYYFFRNDQKQEYFEFDPKDSSCLDAAEFKYFGRVLNELEPLIQDSGLVFYVTAWTVHELPSYGPNVVACILQDEWSREPPYLNKVGMVFRTCGKFPIVPQVYKFGGLQDVVSNFLGQSRAFSRGVVGRVKNLISRIKGNRIAPVYNMPLGYYCREDVAYVPIEERPHDLYFAGSISHVDNGKFSITRPKELARDRMNEALSIVKESRDDIKVMSAVTTGYGESIASDNKNYLETMMNTKICPIPRGANLETFRFFEAIQYGCIPVGEVFPDEYFYKGAPILRLNDWSELHEKVSVLLADAEKLKDWHRKVLIWWEEVCSEKATANFMVEKLKKDILK